MSIKSRYRTSNNKDTVQAHILQKQKESLSVSVDYHANVALLWLFFSVLCFYILLTEKEGYIAVCLVFLCFVMSFVDFLRRYLLFLQLRKIKYASETEMAIQCKDVRFIFHPVGKYTHVILSIILRDSSGNRFYYICPSENAPYDSNRKAIKIQFTEKTVKLKCYQNTNFIKTLPL